ncbi:MAG: thioredoxin family protein [Bacteroidota bacterium]
MKPIYASDPSGLRAVVNAPAVLLYFYHDHCAPCRALRPKVETLLHTQFSEMQLVYVNGMEHRNLSARWQVFGFPTLVGLFEGKEYFRKSKFISLAELSEAIARPYRLRFSLG